MTHPTSHTPPQECPVCGDGLQITRLSCATCGTELLGSFATCSFCSLDEESRALLDLFLLSRGNLKEIERKLDVSYPTVRARVDALIERLGLRSGDRARMDTLEALARGEIAVDDALAALDAQD